MFNFYIVIGTQAESEIEALNKGAKVANLLNDYAEVNHCGTQERVAIVSPDGSVMFRKRMNDD